jgi:ABC-type glutathione transport system ATPase component
MSVQGQVDRRRARHDGRGRREFFKAVPAVRDKLETLERVGLGYIKVGQQATTLSGGEAQRVKLAKELSKRATGRTLYILDEPTTGLHFHDVAKLLEVLHELVDHGNTCRGHRAQSRSDQDRRLDHRPRAPKAATAAARSSTRE